MEQLLLWFNLIAFTLMIGSVGSTYMVYGKARRPWLASYLLYQGAYAVFLLPLVYRYFSTVYLPEPIGFLDQFVNYLRSAIDLLLLWIVPRFVTKLRPEKPSRRFITFCISGSVLVVGTAAAALLTDNWMISWTNKFLYNLYYGALSVIGIFRIRRGDTRRGGGVVVPFLYFSTAYYSVLVVLTVVLLFLTHMDNGFRTNLLLGGIICFIWGGGSLIYLTVKTVRNGSDREGSLPAGFLEAFTITAREREIIDLVLLGRNNRDIADELCISPRTVEAHIYNIYRKCDVRNKMELSSLISQSI